MEKVAYLLACREKASLQGDTGQVRALNADLARLGHSAGVRERAVAAPKRGGRRPMPRCEHGKIVGRCPTCAASE